MKRLLLLLPILSANLAFGSPSGKVFYKTFVNSKEVKESAKTIVEYADSTVKIYSDNSKVKFIPQAVKEATYMDLRKQMIYKVMTTKDGSVYTIKTPFSDLQKLTLKDELTDIIVGKTTYKCKKAEVVLFSNKMELYYTDQLPLKGTPSPRTGIPGGLVLKFVRNGSYELVASEIQLNKSKTVTSLLPQNLGTFVSDAEYYAKSVDNYITTVHVFDNEQICWGWDKPNPKDDQLNEVYHFVNGTVIAKKVTLPKTGPDYTVYAELTQYSNGDAYDRTGSVFIIPMDKKQSFLDGLKNGKDVLPKYKTQDDEYQGVVQSESFSPLLELMRFYTPFGIRHFNDKRAVVGMNWENATYYKQDISELRSKLEGDVWIGTFIGNYDKGGHKVSLDIKYYPGEMEVRENVKPVQGPWIEPLFNTLNVMEAAGQTYGTMFKNDSLTVSFVVPEGLKNLMFRYLSTGHGGWENGDEYVQKRNSIFVDDKLEYSYIPWRTDCGTYRKFNPASGNFWNGISSSDGSRSGWCPGTTTNPVYVDLSHLKPGKHTMKVAIPLGPREGTSFSSWNVSGVLFGIRK
jgi:GLPGLI family protein